MPRPTRTRPLRAALAVVACSALMTACNLDLDALLGAGADPADPVDPVGDTTPDPAAPDSPGIGTGDDPAVPGAGGSDADDDSQAGPDAGAGDGATPDAPGMPGMPGMGMDDGTTMTPPPASADVPVDSWTPLPDGEMGGVPADAIRVAEFVAECPFSHFAADDPIVFPGQPGASHHHTFLGNTGVDANSTLASLAANTVTTCDPDADLSSYWVPTLFEDGQPVEPQSATFYYLGEGVRGELVAQTQPMPRGLQIVAGTAMATGPDDTSRARWSCLHAGQVGSSKDFVNCPEGSALESYLDFPQCWDGERLRTADQSHMAYPVNGACPVSHPVQLPKLRQVLRYPVNGDPSNLRLASGPGYTMHGDFFNVWPDEEMAQRVRTCIRPVVKCGPDGTP